MRKPRPLDPNLSIFFRRALRRADRAMGRRPATTVAISLAVDTRPVVAALGRLAAHTRAMDASIKSRGVRGGRCR